MPVDFVFFGNSESLLSNTIFEYLLRFGGRAVIAIDASPANRTSTNAAKPDGGFSWRRWMNQAGLPVLEPEDPNEEVVIERLNRLHYGLVIAAGYTRRLGTTVTGSARIGAVNFHASLLPDYRGKHPVFWALRNGEKSVGMTVHLISEDIDTGGIVCRASVRTRKEDTVSSLYDRILDKSALLTRQVLLFAAHGALPAAQQPSGAGSYYSGTTMENFRFRWSMTAEQIRRWISATPGKCFFTVNGKRVYCLRAFAEPVIQKIPGKDAAAPGTVMAIGRRTVKIAAGHGVLGLVTLLPEGETEKIAAPFFRLHGYVAGNIL